MTETPVPTPSHDTDLGGSAKAALTIDRTADSLLDLWRAPNTLPRIFAHFATIEVAEQDTAYWRVEGPLGTQYRWQTRASVHAPGQLDWVSLDGADGCCQSNANRSPHDACRSLSATA
jgi:uncharacterized membrane protein